ncbi:MAG: helix-hairpin-helix domain-containing protein [Desulfuromonadaceae bacterium]|nr:helix-hairpin-helix domain-containing protein [Desulfuromonadaceae bacterium]
MKNKIFRTLLTVIALTLATSISFAADAKTDKKALPKAEVAKPAEKKADSKPVGEKAAKGVLVDINSATDAELKAIPGLGDAYAAKIVVGRPYANKSQLKSRNILPGPVYEKVKDLIIAKQAKK